MLFFSIREKAFTIIFIRLTYMFVNKCNVYVCVVYVACMRESLLAFAGRLLVLLETIDKLKTKVVPQELVSRLIETSIKATRVSDVAQRFVQLNQPAYYNSK